MRIKLGLISRWFTDTDATTAVEFSLVGVPFIFLTVGIIELGLMQAAGSILENGLQDAARDIRTGEIQLAGGDTEAAFRDSLCNSTSGIIDCDNIQIEAVIIAEGAFASAENYAPNFDAEGNLISRGFEGGEPNETVLIRAVYNYPIITPMLSEFFAEQGKNTRMLMSTVVMQNEPYLFDVNG
jgi:Flp pilus assembly protein TadG